ncbi:MAG TPA: cupin domain-containing protein [Nitrospiria bacterium]|nr:cupin domain-containing protein [Nitrospiria bacterium]
MHLFDLQKNRSFSPDKLKKNNLAETDRFFCDLYCLESGQEQMPHLHPDSDKIYIVLEGRGRFRIGPEEREIGRDRGVLAPAGVEHGVKNSSSERLVLLVFMAPKP